MQKCPGCMREFGEEYDVCPHCGYIVGTQAVSGNRLEPGAVPQKKKKTKRIVLAAVLCAVLALIAVIAFRGSYQKRDRQTAAQTGAPTAGETQGDASAAEAGNTQTDTGWITAYREYLQGRIQQREADADASDESAQYVRAYFSLIYLDNDDIPELVVSEDNFHAAGATLAAYYDEKIQTYPGLGSFGGFQYKEKQGYIVEGYAGSGLITVNVHRLEEGVLTKIWSGSENQKIFEEDGEPEYLIDERQVSESEYNDAYTQNVPSGLSTSLVEGDISAMQLTRENVQLYFDALEDETSVTTIRPFGNYTYTGTASQIQTDEIASHSRYQTQYMDFVLDEPIVVQFAEEKFPTLITVFRIEAGSDSVQPGHTSVTGRLTIVDDALYLE